MGQIAMVVAYEDDFSREWGGFVRFLRKHQLTDVMDKQVTKVAVHGLFKLMAQKVKVPFNQWNAGSVHRGLFRFLSSAYQEGMDALLTDQIYESMTTFLLVEAETNHIDMNYDQLTALMRPVTAAYLLPYGAEESLPQWQSATSESVRGYVSQWFELFVQSPECAPLLQQSSEGELQMYVMIFTDALYNRQRKTIKNTGMHDIETLLEQLFPGLLFKKWDYGQIQPTLTAFFTFAQRLGYLRPEHVKRMIHGVERGSAGMLNELKTHDWYQFPKLRFAALEQQYQGGGDSQWVREIFEQVNEVKH